MTTILEARAVAREYPTAKGNSIAALRGASLSVEAGEMVAIMGPSGCGKSTLLGMLGGLDRPTSGEVWLAGERIDQLSETQLAKRRRRLVGFVFQFFNLVENLSAADNVELPALIAGISGRDAKERRIELFARLGVSEHARQLPAQLSGGERQRVALARALVNRPLVLLADEPTGSLDSTTSAEVLALLREAHADGQSIVLVTHAPGVASTADRTVHMRDGRMVDLAVQSRAG